MAARTTTTCSAAPGDDWMYGGDGNDRLRGGTGLDDEFGEDGEDRFQIDFASNQADIIDALHGGLDHDYIVLMGDTPSWKRVMPQMASRPTTSAPRP